MDFSAHPAQRYSHFRQSTCTIVASELGAAMDWPVGIAMKKINWGQVAAPAMYVSVIAVLAVFGHSGLQGEHGLAALHRANALERELTAELAKARQEREILENLVRRIRTDYLDLDLLDERARAVLGYVRQDELVIR